MAVKEFTRRLVDDIWRETVSAYGQGGGSKNDAIDEASRQLARTIAPTLDEEELALLLRDSFSKTAQKDSRRVTDIIIGTVDGDFELDYILEALEITVSIGGNVKMIGFLTADDCDALLRARAENVARANAKFARFQDAMDRFLPTVVAHGTFGNAVKAHVFRTK